jgi:hypothetical protein
MTALTPIVDVKSKVSSPNGSGPMTFVNVNVCPVTVKPLLCPLVSPLIGLPSTLYSVVPVGQFVGSAPAPVRRSTPVLPTSAIDRIDNPTTIRARVSPAAPLLNNTSGLPASRAVRRG